MSIVWQIDRAPFDKRADARQLRVRIKLFMALRKILILSVRVSAQSKDAQWAIQCRTPFVHTLSA
jgi:hypothetical protein